MFLELFCCCCCCCCCCCSSSSSSSFSLTARFGSRSLAMRFCLKTPRKGPSIGGGYWPARSIGCCDVGGRSWFDSGRSHWSAGASTSLGREMPSGDETMGRGGGYVNSINSTSGALCRRFLVVIGICNHVSKNKNGLKCKDGRWISSIDQSNIDVSFDDHRRRRLLSLGRHWIANQRHQWIVKCCSLSVYIEINIDYETLASNLFVPRWSWLVSGFHNCSSQNCSDNHLLSISRWSFVIVTKRERSIIDCCQVFWSR